jgi:hypothetical protein
MSSSEEISTNGQEATATAEAQTYDPGLFCWWELGTTDTDGAKAFYTSIFGWSFFDSPMGPEFVYTTFTYDGKSVGSCYKQMPEQVTQGVPPNWLSYVRVLSADETAAKVTEAGGTVLMAPMDVAEHGRMAVIQDPTGAVFGLWQTNQHTGAQLANAVGGVCWTELATHDTEAAKAFYSAVFGWVPETSDMNGMAYTQFKHGNHTAAGMMQITEDWGPVPSHWSPYFTVADADATAEKVTANGGKLLMPPQDIPGIGRFSVLDDPQGAKASFIQLAPMSM